MARITLLCRRSVLAHLAGRPAAVTLGNFDGLHRGHQELLRAVAQEKAKMGPDARSVVVSFYPHPGVVLGKAPRLPLITPIRQKLLFMGDFGIDLFHLIRFTPDFAKLSARQFIDEVLIKTLNTRSLVIGPDARVGHRREGDAACIRRVLEESGRVCREVPFLTEAGEVISSRRIRSLIQEGKVEDARLLLGRPFAYTSTVIEGDKRGRTIGFPTANLRLNRQVLPKFGVYSGWADTEQGRHAFVCNIGLRPTFSGQEVRIEAHLLDYSGASLYGRRMTLHFTDRIRDEMKFSGIDALRVQIEHDIDEARARSKSRGR